MAKVILWRILLPRPDHPGLTSTFQSVTITLTKEQSEKVFNFPVPQGYSPGNWGMYSKESSFDSGTE